MSLPKPNTTPTPAAARVFPLTRWLLAAATLVAVAVAVDAALWWRDAGRNAQIASGQVPAGSPVPELQFAHAQALTAAIDTGGSVAARPGETPAAASIDAALNAWRPLQTHPKLGAAARYNSANLLLRQAFSQRGPGADAALPAQALPLVELAKEQYRELLRRDPGFWDARYNLESAQRLLPDPVESDLEPTAAQRERERAASRMRAQSLGLP